MKPKEPEIFGFADDTDMLNDVIIREGVLTKQGICPLCKQPVTIKDDYKTSSVSYEPSEHTKTLMEAVNTAINSCKDVTMLRRFSKAVDPVNWVYELQVFLEGAVKSATE